MAGAIGPAAATAATTFAVNRGLNTLFGGQQTDQASLQQAPSPQIQQQQLQQQFAPQQDPQQLLLQQISQGFLLPFLQQAINGSFGGGDDNA